MKNEHFDIKLEFKKLFDELNLSTELKDKLMIGAFGDYYLYTLLPIEISQSQQTDVCNEKLIKLSFFSYLYFSSILCYDKYYDNQIDCIDYKKHITTYLFFIKEQALIGLFSLFQTESKFWVKFRELKTIYFKFSDENYLANKNNISDDDFIEIAKGKSILTHNYVYSLKYLFGNIKNEKELISALDCFNVGLDMQTKTGV